MVADCRCALDCWYSAVSWWCRGWWSGVGVDWIGLRLSISVLVRRFGPLRGGRDRLIAVQQAEHWYSAVLWCDCGRRGVSWSVPVWTGSDFVVRFPIRSMGSGGTVPGDLVSGSRGAGRLLVFRGFAVLVGSPG